MLPFNHQCFARSQTSQSSWMRSESWIASRPPFLILPTWSPTTSGWKWLSQWDRNLTWIAYSISISRRQLLLVDIQSEQSASLLLYGAFKQLFTFSRDLPPPCTRTSNIERRRFKLKVNEQEDRASAFSHFRISLHNRVKSINGFAFFPFIQFVRSFTFFFVKNELTSSQ